jgi:hypothetical protein
LIGSDGDFDHALEEDEKDKRWGGSSSHDHQQCLPMHPTASDGDFDHVLQEDEEDKRWGGSSSHDHQQCLPMHPTASYKSSLVDELGSSLEVISELSTSVIESMNALSELGDEHGRHAPMDSDRSKSRWHSQRSFDSEQMNVAVSISPTMPKRIDSDFESLDANLSSSNSSTNSEILTPSHKLSPHTSILRASSEVSMQSCSQKLMDTPMSIYVCPKEL